MHYFLIFIFYFLNQWHLMNRARSSKIVSRTSRVTRWRLNTALEQLNGTKCCCFFCCDQKHKKYSVFLLYCVVWVRKGSQFRLRRNIGRGEEGEDRETKRRRRILKQIGLTIPSLSEVSLEWLVIICALSLSLSLFFLTLSLSLPLLFIPCHSAGVEEEQLDGNC